jgi:outer membrane biosynthesis protein TonB
MNRLQTKCYIASATLHGLLVLVLLVGPAFLAPKAPVNDLPLLTMIPAKLVDEAIFGGGAPGQPAATPAPAPTPVSTLPLAVKPAPLPAPAAPKPIQPVVKPTPKAAEPEAIELPKPPKPTTKEPDETAVDLEKRPKPSGKILPEVTLTPVVRKSGKASAEANKKAQARADAQERAEAMASYQKNVNKVIGGIRSGLSSSVTIEGIGEGGTGGVAYANYGQAIASLFDHAWYDPPTEIADNSLTTLVRVVISRDGTVLARIVRRSGNVVLDKSVERAMLRVRTVPLFPEGAKDNERIYQFKYNLEAKRKNG